MSSITYVPLHLHTHYSLLDGAIKIDELLDKAKEFALEAVAITDHGNIFGAVEFYKKARSKGIKPIIGCEVYVAPGSRTEKTKVSLDETAEEYAFHLILLVENKEGYRNLCELISASYIEGFYYKPRVDKELLARYSKGLIALSACIKGEVPYYIGIGQFDRAKETALQYQRIFGEGNFYLEIQENGLVEQKEINQGLIKISKQTGIPLVATNDCHYLNREDAKAHEVMLCIQTKKTLKDSKRMRFQTDEFYFKSPEQMIEAFSYAPEAISNTAVIAERCNFDFDFKTNYLPLYNPPEGYSADAYLKHIARDGLSKRFKGEIPEEYSLRLERELEMIEKMGFASYFLIVWDFISFAKSRGIPVGPGRGSAAGSLVAYAIGITEIDPIKYNLLFERFLNPERVSMPDIDIDLCQERRQEVINYVTEKYGQDRVAQIITFGAMKAKAAVRDVGRVLGMSQGEIDKIARLIPVDNIKLRDVLNKNDALKDLYDNNPNIKELIDTAIKLEGICRHASKHAAGVVIAPEPITNYMPLYKNPSEDLVITHYEMKAVEDLGLLKFDFLGLATLTIIEKTLQYIRSQGKDLRLEDIPFDDKKTFELLGSGNTTAIFQLESAGMRDILVKMRPTVFEDLIALVALYRPGPMAWIEDFIKRKHGERPIHYEFPELKEILQETYGITVYQEQVMMIAHKIAGFSMGQADILRKAMGKKLKDVMAKQKEEFIKGAVSRGIPAEGAKKLFEDLEPFAEYGFNKSHSASYAYLAYQTAYLKAHFPVEFMAANLSLSMDDTDKIVNLINECRLMGVKVLPPDINRSEREFSIDDGAIRFGLEAVKGVGGSAIELIVQERRKGYFKDFRDFLRRIDSKRVNKRVVEMLIKAGAFDSLFGTSPQDLINTSDLRRLCAIRGEAESIFNGNDLEAVGSLFGEAETEGKYSKAWDEQTLLSNEKTALGFYVSGHPMLKFRRHLNSEGISPISRIHEMEDRTDTSIAGIINDLKSKSNARGLTTYISLEDETGMCECLLFNGAMKKTSLSLEIGNKVIVTGYVLKAEKGFRLMIKDIREIEQDHSNEAKRSYFLEYEVLSEDCLEELSKIRELLRESPVHDETLTLRLHLREYSVDIRTCLKPCEEFTERLSQISSQRLTLKRL